MRNGNGKSGVVFCAGKSGQLSVWINHSVYRGGEKSRIWIFIFLPTHQTPWRTKSFGGVLLHGDLSVLRPRGIVILLPPGAAIFAVDPALTVVFPAGCVNPLEGGKNGSDKRLCRGWSCLKRRVWSCVSYHSQYCHYHSSQEAGLPRHWSVHLTKTCMVQILLQINQRTGKRLSSVD